MWWLTDLEVLFGSCVWTSAFLVLSARFPRWGLWRASLGALAVVLAAAVALAVLLPRLGV